MPHAICQEKSLKKVHKIFFPILCTLPIVIICPLWYTIITSREEDKKVQNKKSSKNPLTNQTGYGIIKPSSKGADLGYRSAVSPLQFAHQKKLKKGLTNHKAYGIIKTSKGRKTQ
jgi:hypothetical protein